MLGCAIGGYNKPCVKVLGGVDHLYIGDSNDFDWTSDDVDANDEPTGYSVLERHAGATASNSIGSITVTVPGTGYTTAPTVVFTGGGGTGAAGTAVLTGTTVTSVTITNAGSSYETLPTISFTGGAGSGAAGTAVFATGGAHLYEIDSIAEFISLEITQSNADGSSSSYEYLLLARLAQMSMQLTNFSDKLDAAALCCQLVFVLTMNDGTIFVFGEKYVDAATIPRFRFRQDGSKITTGKKFEDFNGDDLSIKGKYSRLPYVFTGGIAGIDAMVAS